MIHGTGTHGLTPHGDITDGMTRSMWEAGMTLGITADSTIHGSTEVIMTLGITEDSIVHGTTEASTDHTIADGMEDGTRSGLDITLDTTQPLTTMEKKFGEVRDMKPVQTGYLQAARPQGEASVRQRQRAEK